MLVVMKYSKSRRSRHEFSFFHIISLIYLWKENRVVASDSEATVRQIRFSEWDLENTKIEFLIESFSYFKTKRQPVSSVYSFFTELYINQKFTSPDIEKFRDFSSVIIDSFDSKNIMFVISKDLI